MQNSNEPMFGKPAQPNGFLNPMGDIPKPLDNKPKIEDIQLEGYTILGIMGQGGMGIVYKAIDNRLGREVALKMILNSNEIHKQRFQREAKILAESRHEHIISIYEYRESPHFYYTMPLLEDSLEKKLARSVKLSLADSVSFTIAIAKALEHCHQKGIIHRDLKPANILLDGNKPIVTDFGLALLKESMRLSGGKICGTIAYMPPEQLNGETPDVRSDLYSLGILFIEMLTGKLKVCDTDSTWQNMDQALQNFCRKLLAVDKNKRPNNAQEVIAFLEQYCKANLRDTVVTKDSEEVIANAKTVIIESPSEPNYKQQLIAQEIARLQQQYERYQQDYQRATGPGSRHIAELRLQEIMQQLEEKYRQLE